MLLVFERGIFLDRLNVLDFENLNVDFALLNQGKELIFLVFLNGVVLDFVDFVEVLLMGGSQN